MYDKDKRSLYLSSLWGFISIFISVFISHLMESDIITGSLCALVSFTGVTSVLFILDGIGEVEMTETLYREDRMKFNIDNNVNDKELIVVYRHSMFEEWSHDCSFSYKNITFGNAMYNAKKYIHDRTRDDREEKRKRNLIL